MEFFEIELFGHLTVNNKWLFNFIDSCLKIIYI